MKALKYCGIGVMGIVTMVAAVGCDLEEKGKVSRKFADEAGQEIREASKDGAEGARTFWKEFTNK